MPHPGRPGTRPGGAFRRLGRDAAGAGAGHRCGGPGEWALDQVTGVDVNPFAVAIARFRPLVAALKVCDRGWVDIELDEEFEPLVDQLVVA